MTIRIEPLGPIFGAKVTGCDLGQLDDETFAEIRSALVANEVLVFTDQAVTTAEHIAFGRRFGPLSVSTFSPSAAEWPELIVLDNSGDNPKPLTDIWHSDETFRHEPPMATVLRSRIVPRFGGDTMFASMTAAYDGLSDRMKQYLDGLTATHGLGRFGRRLSEDPTKLDILHEAQRLHPPAHHPVIRVHPESGRRAVFVNSHFTTRIDGVADDESDAILGYLLRQSLIAEYQLRVRWEPDQITMWDNRSVQHYAPNDYLPQRRLMERVTICGDKPLGAIVPTDTADIVGGVVPRSTGPSLGSEDSSLTVARATDRT